MSSQRNERLQRVKGTDPIQIPSRGKWEAPVFSALVAFGFFFYQAFLLLLVAIFLHLRSVFEELESSRLFSGGEQVSLRYAWVLLFLLPIVFFMVQVKQRIGRERILIITLGLLIVETVLVLGTTCLPVIFNKTQLLQ